MPLFFFETIYPRAFHKYIKKINWFYFKSVSCIYFFASVACARMGACSVSESLTDKIQADFIALRAQSKDVSQDILHYFITLARCIFFFVNLHVWFVPWNRSLTVN
jgi:hypothetical protein